MSKITDFSMTITALATALGTGSIAIIRVSGKNSWHVVSKIFNGIDLMKATPNSIHFGRIFNGTREVDQVVVLLFKAPSSYTGEDCVEISCHANPLVVDEIISLLVKNGAIHAKPGEFSLRSYLNGKMDLSQAEAVSGIIKAKSRPGVYNSLYQLEGALTEKIQIIKNELISLTARLETDLDFSEENITIASRDETVRDIEKSSAELIKLAETFNLGRIFDSGINLVIIGEPNVGKSTLMNTLLGQNRVITSAIPGTTRDTIKENLLIDNIYVTLTDTAGLRFIDDEVESEGVRRAEETIESADIILYVVDLSKKLSIESKKRIIKFLGEYKEKIILIGNKNDCARPTADEMITRAIGLKPLKISAKNNVGIDNVRDSIRNSVQNRYESFGDEVLVTSARQRDALMRAAESLLRAKKSVDKNEGYEFATIELRDSLNSLGEITGETVSDDILNYIFSKFCIGK